ncbi:MAG TPA: ureidoglycolate lyase [Allocoleopsis sp.]
MIPSTFLHLPAQPITPDTFQPYGQVIFATPDGKTYDAEDAQLQLDQGVPRLYIMRLYNRGKQFTQITRHQKCTQCLGALQNLPWFIAVAPPHEVPQPALETIVAFAVPGNCFIKLNVGTWHAGPYFEQDFVDFYNLELSDTNITDHDTCDLSILYGIEFEIV